MSTIPPPVVNGSMPGQRRMVFGVLCWLNRHPRIWRAIGTVFRWWPRLGAAAGFFAHRSTIASMLERPDSFVNTSHAPNLVAGEFLIGMESDDRYRADKALFAAVMPTVEEAIERSVRSARARSQDLHARRAPFDLIDDYLAWVVHDAIMPSFGDAAAVIAAPADPADTLAYLGEIRNVAAQLFAGTSAPDERLRRAEASARALKSRMKNGLPLLPPSWSAAADEQTIERDATGLTWVSHPVTVQGAALVIAEMLTRPDVQKALRMLVEQSVDPWTDDALRGKVEGHVVELMRFRPVFPILNRDVPRDTMLTIGKGHQSVCPAGRDVKALTIAALFDGDNVGRPGTYCPARPDGDPKTVPFGWAYSADRYLMFGHGTRRCPARREAVAIVTSALIGLLAARPTIAHASMPGGGSSTVYDGPMVSHLYLEYRR